MSNQKNQNIFKSKTIKNIVLLTLITVCFTVAQTKLYSQENRQNDAFAKFYFGGFGGYNLNMHFGNFTEIDPGCPTCIGADYGDYGFTTGSGFAIGGLFEYPLYKKLNGQILVPANKIAPMSLGVRLGYSMLNGNFNVETKIGNAEQNGRVVDAISAHILKTEISALQLSPYFAYNIFGNLVGTVGLNVGILMSNNFSQREELLEPINAVYKEEQARVRNRFDNREIPNANSLQMGLSLGFGYQIPLGRHSFLVPEISYNFNFTNISDVKSKSYAIVNNEKIETIKDGNWRASALQIGVAFKFPVLDKPTVTPQRFYQRDTTIEYKIGITEPEIVLTNRTVTKQGIDTLIIENWTKFMPQTVELLANLSFHAIENRQRKDVVSITIEEFEKTESFPLLPIIYFPDGNSDLTRTRMRLLNANQISNFNENELEADKFTLYYHTLNILAKRLIDNPGINNVSIVGFSSGSGADAADRNIWKSRAEVVRDYFVNVWKIPANRLRIEQGQIDRRNVAATSVNDITEENQKVEIRTDRYELMRPIVLYEIERIANPPQLVFEMNGRSDAGLTNYNLVLSQSGNRLREFSETVSSNQFNASQTWTITEDPLPLLERPIDALLTVRDNLNQTQTVNRSIEVEQKTIRSKRALVENDMRIERYSLVLFDFDSDVLHSIHRRVLDEVRNSVQPNSQLFIFGYADRTGDHQHNENLARRRCERVNSHINPNNRVNAVLEAIGSRELIYNNDIPEGRAFSRTVKIEIRTPIQ